MTPQRWQQITEVFHAALERNPSHRAAFLAIECGADPELRRAVESLMAAHDEASRFGDVPVSMPLPLEPGTSLGPYVIDGPLGAGGMGAVYRARDPRLGRDVAIKVLPSHLTSDPERVARFAREARLLASLNHPHIGAIYGVEESDAGLTLVMELVEGEDLAQRIARNPIPLAEALAMAAQIAEALEAAHEQGIIHRDLKPANIKVREDGMVKVLDFGLARALAPVSFASVEVMRSPARSVHETEPGMILGTAAYMSPEQANGAAVDRRTDIFAFGAVLYEMLTGARAFPGEARGDIVAAVIRTEPDWTRLPADTPAGIRRLLRRCLQKDRSRRLQTAGDARIEIDEAVNEPPMDADVVVPSAPPMRERFAWTALALVTLIAAAVVGRALSPVLPAPEMRLEITTPPTNDPESLAISPDGQKVVFSAISDGQGRLWLRALDATARPLTGTDNASSPFWSPDSRSIGFFADGKLKRIDLDRGAVQVLADANNRSSGGTWSLDGVILFSAVTEGPLFRMPASGGDAVALTELNVTGASRFPDFLPDGRHFLFYAEGSEHNRGIYLGSLDSLETKRLTATDSAGVYLSPGWLLFIRQRTLVAERFDPSRGELSGEQVTVADSVGFDSRLSKGAFSVSAAGVVAYRSEGPARQLTWFDHAGQALETLGAPDESDLVAPALSPDGRRVMVHRTLQDNTDLWLIDGARMTRFTFHSGVERWPLWSPDGTHIVFGSNRTGAGDLYLKPSSGVGSEELLLASPRHKAANSWSRDGRFLLYTSMDPKGADLWVLPLDGDRKPFVFLDSRFDERVGQFSPDGRWVAYQSNESGKSEIYVRPFSPSGRQWQISTSGGLQARWRRDGAELYYIAPDGKLMAVPMTVRGDTLDPGAPQVLFQTRIWGGGTNDSSRQQYDVAPDGRFLINVTTEDATNTPITLLLNWKPKPRRARITKRRRPRWRRVH